MADKSNIPTSKYPHLRRQYREYKRKKNRQGAPPGKIKTWDEWLKTKPEIKTISEKRKKRNSNSNSTK